MVRTVKTALEGAVAGTGNMVLRAVSERLEPQWLWFGVTDRCNSRCTHCNIWREKATSNPLSVSEIKHTLSDPLFKNVQSVLISGGEPTLRTDLEDVVRAIHGTIPKAEIVVSTNGLLPDRMLEIVRNLIHSKIPISVGTSVDGLDEKHDTMRGVNGNFAKVDYMLRELVALREKHPNKLSVTVQFTLSDLNADSVWGVRAYARELNVGLLEGWYNEAPFYSNPKREAAAPKIFDIVKSQVSCPLQETWLRMLKGKSIRFPCFAMYTFCVLKCNGDIVPCLNLWDEKAGNVRHNTPSDIWHSSSAKEVRRKVKACEGCLNSWGCGWSYESSSYQFLLHYLKHPLATLKKIGGVK